MVLPQGEGPAPIGFIELSQLSGIMVEECPRMHLNRRVHTANTGAIFQEWSVRAYWTLVSVDAVGPVRVTRTLGSG